MIQVNNLPDKLVEFLQFEKALEKYRTNVTNLGQSSKLTEDSETMWIDEGFNWSTTPEGNNYWDNLDTRWDEYLDGDYIIPKTVNVSTLWTATALVPS